MLWLLAVSAIGNLVFGYLWVRAANRRDDLQFAHKLAMDSVALWRERATTKDKFRKGA